MKKYRLVKVDKIDGGTYWQVEQRVFFIFWETLYVSSNESRARRFYDDILAGKKEVRTVIE